MKRKNLLPLIFGVFVCLFLNALLLSGSANETAPGHYQSICLHPDFSPDETFIAYFDSQKLDTSPPSWTNTLKIYDIAMSTSRTIYKTVFHDTPMVWCSEIIEEFQQVKWSPDGKYLALSLDGMHIEIYDVKKDTVISKLTFKRKPDDDYLGYYYIDWRDNRSLIVGYISKYAGLINTDDTYGLIEQEGDQFVIRQPVIPPDSPMAAGLYPTMKANADMNVSKGVPMVTLKPDQTIETLTYSDEEFDRYSDIFYFPASDSRDWAVLKVSKTGVYAIVARSSKDDTPLTALIRVPGKFRKQLAK